MQLTYLGQSYNYPYSEQVLSSPFKPVCQYRGVETKITQIVAQSTVPHVASSDVVSLRYRGISYLRTLTPMSNSPILN